MEKDKLATNLTSSFLFTGIACFLIGFLSVIFLFDSGRLYDSTRAKLISSFPLLYFLIYAALIAPIFEEFIFRYILVRNKRKRFYKIMGILMLLYIPTFFGKWYLAILLLPLVVCVFYTVRYAKLWISLSSSLVFALAHIYGFDLLMLTLLLMYLGLGMLFSYTAEKYGILASMSLHIFYNSLLLTPTFALFFSDMLREPINIKNAHIEASIRFVSANPKMGSFSDFSKEYITTNNASISSIAEGLLPRYDCLIINEVSLMRKLDVKIKSDKQVDISKELLNILHQHNLVLVDSIQKNGIYYQVLPQANCDCQNAEYQASNTLLGDEYIGVSEISQFIYTHYSKVVIMKSQTSLKCYRYKVNFDKLRQLSFNQLIYKLQKDYCLNLVKTKGNYREIKLSDG